MKITDVKPQVRHPDRVSVYVDGAYSFSLDQVDFVKMGLKIGMELTEKQITTCNLEGNLSKARNKALSVLSRRDICEQELRRKLKTAEVDDMIADIVIDELLTLGYLDDYAYAEKFVQEAQSLKLWGMHKIRYELARKGVASEIIKEVCQGQALPEKEGIFQIVSHKYKDVDWSDQKQKQRIIRYLASKGYSFSEITAALHEMAEGADLFE